MLENSKSILLKAREEGYAIPQFNINNLEWTRYILEECDKNNQPVILGASEGAIKYMGGYHVVVNLIMSLKYDLNIKIPIVIHLDHGSSYDSCVKAIEAGFTSVMIDASKLPFLDNIALTKKVVDYAHARNVTVEAELGVLGGNEDGIKGTNKLADPDECVTFVQKTKIDSLAPAVGSAHGVYIGEPHLDFALIETIKNKVNVPLVLHGGSGIPDFQIKESIKRGISKININTEIQQGWHKGVLDFMEKNPDIYDPRKVISSGEEEFKKVVKEKIDLFR